MRSQFFINSQMYPYKYSKPFPLRTQTERTIELQDCAGDEEAKVRRFIVVRSRGCREKPSCFFLLCCQLHFSSLHTSPHSEQDRFPRWPALQPGILDHHTFFLSPLSSFAVPVKFYFCFRYHSNLSCFVSFLPPFYVCISLSTDSGCMHILF